jgi:hypothetical protein
MDIGTHIQYMLCYCLPYCCEKYGFITCHYEKSGQKRTLPLRNGIAYYVPICITYISMPIVTHICNIQYVHSYYVQIYYQVFLSRPPYLVSDHFVGQNKLIQVSTSLC